MSVRVDKWLWSVRVFKTRTSASAACNAGRVRVNDEVAKPATRVDVGDLVEARRGDRLFIHRVTNVIEKRVGADRARECYDDQSPPAPERSAHSGLAPTGGARERGAGRPTKRERRQIDRLRGRPPGERR
ncbi:MAG: RNA-binding S4 domain-containing protein [Acidimicrobiia bacterium]|nr:RNA-binding S4 domain-containing protein [Acidimicrobiia bacterium]